MCVCVCVHVCVCVCVHVCVCGGTLAWAFSALFVSNENVGQYYLSLFLTGPKHCEVDRSKTAAQMKAHLRPHHLRHLDEAHHRHLHPRQQARHETGGYFFFFFSSSSSPFCFLCFRLRHVLPSIIASSD